MDVSGDLSDNSDLGAAVLKRFEASKQEEHQRLCATVGAMSQSLKDQSIPLTPVAYFSATFSSLDRLSKDPASASDPITASLLVFLSCCVPAVPVAVVRSKGALVCETVVRILGFGSLSDNGVKAGLKCIAGLIVVGDKSSWLNLSPSYCAVLRSATEHRPKVARITNYEYTFETRVFFSHAILIVCSFSTCTKVCCCVNFQLIQLFVINPRFLAIPRHYVLKYFVNVTSTYALNTFLYKI